MYPVYVRQVFCRFAQEFGIRCDFLSIKFWLWHFVTKKLMNMFACVCCFTESEYNALMLTNHICIDVLYMICIDANYDAHFFMLICQ